jgi:hypothetical protein
MSMVDDREVDDLKWADMTPDEALEIIKRSVDRCGANGCDSVQCHLRCVVASGNYVGASIPPLRVI